METNNDQQVAGDISPKGFGFRLQIVISFIKKLINEFKVTQQELIDAGVFIREN